MMKSHSSVLLVVYEEFASQIFTKSKSLHVGYILNPLRSWRSPIHNNCICLAHAVALISLSCCVFGSWAPLCFLYISQPIIRVKGVLVLLAPPCTSTCGVSAIKLSLKSQGKRPSLVLKLMILEKKKNRKGQKTMFPARKRCGQLSRVDSEDHSHSVSTSQDSLQISPPLSRFFVIISLLTSLSNMSTSLHLRDSLIFCYSHIIFTLSQLLSPDLQYISVLLCMLIDKNQMFFFLPRDSFSFRLLLG